MTFKIIKNPEFTSDVPVPMPGGGEQMLKTTFRGISEEEMEAFDVMTRDGLKDAVRGIVIAFHDVEIGAGIVLEKVSLDEEREAYETLLSQPNVRVAVNNFYQREMVGYRGARRGN